MKHLHTFENFLYERAEKKLTVSLASKAVASFKKDLDSNKIQYVQVKPTVFELDDMPKSRMSIQLAKERFGMQSVLVKESFLNEDYRNTDPSLKEYVGKTVKAILEDDDGENSYVTIQFNDSTQMKITAHPLGSGGVGLVVESLDEKIEYPEGVKTTGDKILDKLAKLLNSPQGTIEVGSGSVRGKKVPFSNGDAYFNISAENDYYVLLCKNGEFEIAKSEIKNAEDLYDQIEKAIQLGNVTLGKKR